jgi:adenylate cyclase
MSAIAPRRRLAVLSFAGSSDLPERVRKHIRSRDNDSERLIGRFQLGLVGAFALLFIIAPRPADAPMMPSMWEPVPAALITYASFTIVRLWFAHRGPLPGPVLIVSILADVGLLLALIWSFHNQYHQPAPFSLKVPTFIYVFVFIALRALRFDPRYVLTAGLAAAAGWALLLIAVLADAGRGAITRSFTDYLSSNHILLGAEFDKIFTILLVTGILVFAIAQARTTLVTAVAEQAAGREIRRFLSERVAETITHSDNVIEAGQAIERNAAILMLDIRGFTRFSMRVPPREVVRLLTNLHARIIPAIEANGGIIDKFLGDGVMATFGAVETSPTAAADALRALDATMAEAARWRQEIAGSSGTGKLDVNGAVVAGPVVFATLGNADRLEYTVIGEAVNLAAKLEKHNKVEGTRALVPLATLDLAHAQGYKCDPLECRRQSKVADVATPLDLVVLCN